MPKVFFDLLGICSKLNKKQHFDELYQFKKKQKNIQIQTRHVRDCLGKENTTISLVD